MAPKNVAPEPAEVSGDVETLPQVEQREQVSPRLPSFEIQSSHLPKREKHRPLLPEHGAAADPGQLRGDAPQPAGVVGRAPRHVARALQEDRRAVLRRRVGLQPDAAAGRGGRAGRLEGRRGQGGWGQVGIK